MKPRLPPQLRGHDSAAAWFKTRVPMTDEEHAQADDRAARRAFWVGGVSQLRMVTDVFDAIDDAVSNGTTYEDFRDEVGDKLFAAWGSEEPWRLETIFRTNVQHAYSAGRHFEMRQPAVLALRPYWKLEMLEPCPICQPFEDAVVPADDPFWDTHTPPFHFNCVCAVVSLMEDEVSQRDVEDEPDKLPEVMDGFGDAPDEGDLYEPDLSVFPPELVAVFRDVGNAFVGGLVRGLGGSD